MTVLWYIAAVFAGLVFFAVALILELRTSPKEEARRIELQNQMMVKVKDDPNEPARFVP